MSSAFILNDETVLCRQTPSGWWPLQVQLPQSDNQTESSASDYQQAYQIGQVALFESLAPSHWLPSDATDSLNEANENVDSNAITAQAASAITYDYAIAHNITLPIILESNTLENSNLESRTLETDNLENSSFESNANAFVPYRQLITQLPMALSDQLSQAIQLLRWQADTQFCSRCAAPVVHAKRDDRAMVCQVCRLRQYPRVQPCIITAITRPNPQTGEMQILLAHHHRYGQQKTALQSLQYGLIAGFVEVGESLEHAVVREVAEEVGISLSDIHYVSSQPWPFPSNLMLGFRASYAGGDIVIQEDELSHADFFDLSDLPKIPSKGSIAYELIAQIAHEQGLSL
ncbi:NAD(+) diphosphatase [Psychrobacter sp. DAB_AL32B]|uniref:NAD(+) diphosphatase n=1 Tax=Psychrobacter sp. DAB_AL32B TaxID=1028414 RepID=UPI000B7FA0AA|nr:NAD(+) diphosphatase [Psychrobacter sp. DAB_AL32B]OXL23824.1 NADH pyrophosphatase [Psychrobacter sp. DAB_AL32B]